ncbi:matrixin family metalloprotease [Myxococcota bacterium]|nr:matrixin family metalloprotease [Myxococcota bacterium]
MRTSYPSQVTLILLFSAAGCTGKSTVDDTGAGEEEEEGEVLFDNEEDGTDSYSLQGSKWEYTDLTWCLSTATSDLDRDTIEATVAEAASKWATVSPLTFTMASTCTGADIEVLFASGDHGDGEPFDGKGGVLAHAWYPETTYSGDAHFDDDEDWTDEERSSSASPRDLLTVALHEFGHSLGLKHSAETSAVMYKSYGGSRRDLTQDDIDGIQALYGESSGDCTIEVTHPDGGETLEIGTSYTIEWESDCTSNVQVHLYKGGSYYYTLAANDPNDGDLEFTPISSFPEDNDYQICISTTDDSVFDCGDEFTISGTSECGIEVTYPDGGETLEIGTSYVIEWESDCTSNVQVHLYKGGGYYYTLAANDPNDGDLEFTPISSFPEDNDYQICISTTDDSVAGCGGDFSISNGSGGGDGDVELCLNINSSSGYSCADWVSDGAGVEDESCDLDYAEDGELWVYEEGWDGAPVASDGGSFTELCATIEAESGDVFYVNGRFENTDSEVPILYGGEWWWCANWYGVGAYTGTFTVDGVAVTPTLYDPGTGGYDCLVEVP